VNAVLVAGIGNIFMTDDGFGVEVVRRLSERELPAGVELVDVGIRGMHLAYQLLDGYAALVLVDTTARGGEPGQLYLLEHDLSQIQAPADDPADDSVDNISVPDAHDMGPDTVLALLGSLATASGQTPTAGLRRVLVVGCEPASTEDGIGLTDPVAASVDRAATAVTRVVAELLAELVPTPTDDHAELRGAVHVPRHTG
jgi:hydrogenase maturation protease